MGFTTTMSSKSNTSSRNLATQSRRLPSRIPRTMPVTSPESVDFSTPMADISTANFSLTSRAGQRQPHVANNDLVHCNSFSDSGSDDYLMTTPSTMSYVPMTSSHNFTAPVMTTMGSYDFDSSYDFLADAVVSSNTSADMSFMSFPYQGQGQPQDHLTSYLDVSMCAPSVLNNFCGQDSISWSAPNRPDTPPPEDYIQEFLPQQFSSVQAFQDDTCPADQDITVFDVHDSKSSAYSISRSTIPQPRPIRSASERSDPADDHNMCVDTRTIKEEQIDKVKAQARSHPLYDAKVQEDGKFHCPYKSSGTCNHDPTGQRCIYNKYLDSHLRPYRCKYAESGDCEETRFSSNACLFRHEREAHGMHNHGLNPFLCKFADCDRSREGNGFPRRWNQRDHMRRVHDYEEKDPKERSTASETSKRRKGSGAPTSTAMRRSTSSAHAKAQAMAGAAIPKHYPRVNQARYAAPRTAVYWPDGMQCCVTPGVPV